ncbi:ABC transporter ATP-binding protein [soil metagenome]
MAPVSLRNLTVRFGAFTAVDDISLDIADGEFVVFLGPSGCGKTTTLRCIAGLEHPTSGEIRFGDKVVNDLDASQRNVAMVFQFISLYPHLRIRGNIAFPLQARGMPRDEIAGKVAWVSKLFDLEDILDKYPGGLPPGAKQKAALARSVVREPNVLLLDEPLSAIDEQFREEMRWELRHLQKRLGVTAIYVTHDQREAMSLADRVVLMRDGKLVQVGKPGEFFTDPADAFAGFFVGSPAMNVIDVTLEAGRLCLGEGGPVVKMPDAIANRLSAAGAFQIGIRPQHVTLGSDPQGVGCFPARTVSRYAIGREHWFDFALVGKTFKGTAHEKDVHSDDIVVKLETEHMHFFTSAGDRIRLTG